LVGESLRDIGILLLVFVPLDAIFYQGAIAPGTRIALVMLAFVGLGLPVIGVLVEGRK
jgi:hypothetical protein